MTVDYWFYRMTVMLTALLLITVSDTIDYTINRYSK